MMMMTMKMMTKNTHNLTKPEVYLKPLFGCLDQVLFPRALLNQILKMSLDTSSEIKKFGQRPENTKVSCSWMRPS